MRFNSVIISSFFVSVVLAAPRRERRLSGVANTLTDHLAGAILTINEGQGDMQSVSSTIHVPDIAGQKSDFFAAVAVGLDGTGSSCDNALQLGVVFQVSENGPSYKVQYEHDHASIPFPEIDVKAGDEIQLIAYANLMQGSVNVVNLNNNQNVTHQFNLTENLCGKSAFWLVGVKDVSMSLGTPVTFANYEVGGRDFNSGQLDSETINIVKDGNLLTNASADGHSVTVNWL